MRIFVLFLKNSYGTVVRPYETYRQLSLSTQYPSRIIFIHFLVLTYFLWTTAIKTGFSNPFILTLKFNSLYFSGLAGFVMMILLFFALSRLFHVPKFPHYPIIVLWSYSLLPTVIWFYFTSLMYLLLPPPRTLTYQGKFYSLAFLAVSLTLLLWKIILYYLTLRFGLRFDLFRISVASLIILPAIGIYSWIMYAMGIFKIPFI